jgi:chromosome segregation ATPase
MTRQDFPSIQLGGLLFHNSHPFKKLWRDCVAVRSMSGFGVGVLVLLVTGCASTKELHKLETQLEHQLQETHQQIEQQRARHSQDLQVVEQGVQAVRQDLRQLSAQHQVQFSEAQAQVNSGLKRLDQQGDALEKVWRELENVRTDMSRLKPLRRVLDQVQEQLETTDGVINALKTDTAAQKATISKLEGSMLDIQALQKHLQGATDRLRAVVGEIGEGMVQRLKLEMRYARDRLYQLEQVLDHWPVEEKDENSNVFHMVPPG